MKAIFFIAIALVCAVGCGLWADSDEPPELTETWLSEMLRSVPTHTDPPHHLRYLWVANYEAALTQANLIQIDGFYLAWNLIIPPGNYAHMPRQEKALLGLDFVNRNQSAWIDERFFRIHTGELGDPAQIRKRLSDLGYERYDYRGVDYYRFATSIGSAEGKHPSGTLFYTDLNNIAFVDDRMFVTSLNAENIELIVDVREGLVRSMWDEERWRILAKVVGDELLGGILIAPEYFMGPFEPERRVVGGERTGAETLEDWSRYAEGPEAWGTLEPYTALAMGFTVSSGEPGTLIALYHPDPGAADGNALELKHRWKTARMDLRRLETGFTTAQRSRPGEDIPFTEMCAPLDTRTVIFDDSSVLLATCPAILREGLFGGTQGVDFYWGLFNYDELHFLVPDLSGLAAE